MRTWKQRREEEKERKRSMKDLTLIRQIKDRNGGLLTDPDEIRMRWQD